MDGQIDYQQQYIEPNTVILQQDSGERIKLREVTLKETFKQFFLDLPNPDQIKVYRFANSDESISFHYAIHPTMKAIIAPPNGIKMDDEYRKTGIGNQIQAYLESKANTYGYRLMAGLTLQSVAAFSGRVIEILRNYGYHIGPPTNQSEIHLCIHDDSYTGNGIPEVDGMDKKYFIPPTKTNIKKA